MNSNNPIRNYKHDISGKFRDITAAISLMDESVFHDTENNEIFHAVHEVLLKMVKTSRNTMIENLKQEIILIVSSEEPDLSLQKLQIEGVTLRYSMKEDEVFYYIFKAENEGDSEVLVSIARTFLPIKKIQGDI